MYVYVCACVCMYAKHTHTHTHTHTHACMHACIHAGNTIMPCEKGKEVVFGGVCKAADVPTPTVKYSAPAKSEW